MGGVFIIGYILLILIVPFWVYSDASRRHGESQSIGCLWALMMVALGPLALIAYLLVRPPLPEEEFRRRAPALRKDCAVCGTPNPQSAGFCTACGEDFADPHDRLS